MKKIAEALDRHDGLAIAAGLTLIFLSIAIPSFFLILLIHIFVPLGLWMVPVIFGAGIVGHWFLNFVLFKEKPPQLPAPKTGLERIKEDYALGEIDFAKLEQRIERELYLQAHAVESPPKIEAPKPKEKKPPDPYLSAALRQYQAQEIERAMYEQLQALRWNSREDRV